MTRMQRYLLVAILLFTAATRLYKLTDYPGALGTEDEVVVGYDAYCLLHTLRDHHGEFPPALPRMFNDYLSGVQTYWTIPFVGLMGLTEQAVRLACALPNVVAVFLMFLLARRLLPERGYGSLGFFCDGYSPWHLYFSRWAVQPNLVKLFFLLLFLLVFFKASGQSLAEGRDIARSATAGAALVLLTQIYPAQMFFALLLAVVLGLIYLRRHFRRLFVLGAVATLGMLPVCDCANAQAGGHCPVLQGDDHLPEGFPFALLGSLRSICLAHLSVFFR